MGPTRQFAARLTWGSGAIVGPLSQYSTTIVVMPGQGFAAVARLLPWTTAIVAVELARGRTSFECRPDRAGK